MSSLEPRDLQDPDPQDASAGAQEGTSAAHDPEVQAKLAAARERIQAAFGQVALTMMSLPRYRHQSVADLSHLILEPLISDRIAFATARPKGEAEALAGFAIWASVSDQVDKCIREQVAAKAFPVRLKREDWASGEAVWLLDLVAPSKALATSVLGAFRQVARGRPVNIHPVVTGVVEPGALEKMKATSFAADCILGTKWAYRQNGQQRCGLLPAPEQLLWLFPGAIILLNRRSHQVSRYSSDPRSIGFPSLFPAGWS